MPQKSKPAKNPTKRSTVAQKNIEPRTARTTWLQARQWIGKKFLNTKDRLRNFLSRRPHRSFRPSRRRDYRRSLKLPGYWSLTSQVIAVIKKNWRSLAFLALLYMVLTGIFVGAGSQESFNDLREEIADASHEIMGGDWSALGQATIATFATIAGQISPEIKLEQQLYAIFFGLLTWLTTVWLLRHRLAGQPVKLRDALYSAGAPIVAMIVLVLVAAIQLIPVAVAMTGLTAAGATGLISNGVEAMLAWSAAVGLIALSVYWLSTTAIAFVIVTNPGTYPLRALSIAGDIVVGRRIRIILRLLWLAALVAVVWVVMMIVSVLVDSWLKSAWTGLELIPIVPLAMLLLGAATFILSSTYIYLLYRKIIEDDSKPA